LATIITFGAKKTDFEKANPTDGTRIIKSDLETLKQAMESFIDAVITAEPVSVLALVR
jgi:hypothetical protein